MQRDLELLGSQTARNGFLNEDFVRNEFNNWQYSSLSQEWLLEMGYNLDEIESVHAEKLHGYKTDVQVNIIVVIKMRYLTDVQNIQVKLVSNENGFNQIDKRWVDKYSEMWRMPENIKRLLKLFTGEMPPYRTGTIDPRRMKVYEFTAQEQQELISFLEQNKILIVTDIIKGRGEFHAEWMLVIKKLGEYNLTWVLKTINEAMNYFGGGEVVVGAGGSIKIGKITMQRKGGDGGRSSSKMLQFKINPARLFDI